MVAEAGDPVPWTKPEDLAYDEAKPLPKLCGMFAGGFNAGFADGSARFIGRTVPDRVLRAVITSKGDELVTPDQL